MATTGCAVLKLQSMTTDLGYARAEDGPTGEPVGNELDAEVCARLHEVLDHVRRPSGVSFCRHEQSPLLRRIHWHRAGIAVR